jgi:predicted MFS family arabinose efflux permease
MPATLSIIANVFTGDERTKAIAIWAALAAIGIGLGPLAGGLMLEWFSWWSVFMVNVPFAAAAVLLGIRYLPESRDPRPGAFDLPGAALSTAGFSVLVYAIIEAPSKGWTSGPVLGSLAASVVLLGLFFALGAPHRRADARLELFPQRPLQRRHCCGQQLLFALLGAIFALTQYLQFAHGYSAVEAGAVMSPMTLGLMIGAGSSSKALFRLGSGRVVGAGLAGTAALLALTLLWGPSTSALWLVAWFFGVTLAIGWVMAPATDAVVGAVPPAKSGVASATNTVARMVSGALGVAVVGSLVSSLYSSRLDGLPPRVQAHATDSIGVANAIAAQLPPHAATGLLASAGDAFTDAMGIGLTVGAALLAVTALLVLRFLPARAIADAEVAELRMDVPTESEQAA